MGWFAQIGLDAHLFELDPHHYYQDNGNLVKTQPYRFVIHSSQVGPYELI